MVIFLLELNEKRVFFIHRVTFKVEQNNNYNIKNNKIVTKKNKIVTLLTQIQNTFNTSKTPLRIVTLNSKYKIHQTSNTPL